MTSTTTTSTSGIAADASVIAAARRRIRRGLVVDRGTGLLTGGSFLAVMATWLVLAPPRSVPIEMFIACVVAQVGAASVEFEIGPGCALPTTPVQVVMLFILPFPLVPVAVFLGLVGAAQIARLADSERRERILVIAASGWQVVGPAAVFAIARITGPSVADWPVYGLALCAQFGLDGTTSWVRNCYGLSVPVGTLAVALRFTFLCDLLLAPIGFAAALALPGSAGALLLLVPLMLLLALLQSDRQRQLDKTITLGAALTATSQLARRDALTGVSNRLAFEETAQRLTTSDFSIGVVLADVDGLKVANDTYGHAMGDRLLVAVAEIIVGTVSEAATPVYRIGGDEFAILLDNASPATTDRLADRLRSAFETAPDIDDHAPLSASVGSGFAPSGPLLGTAIARADHAVSDEKTRRGLHRC